MNKPISNFLSSAVIALGVFLLAAGLILTTPVFATGGP